MFLRSYIMSVLILVLFFSCSKSKPIKYISTQKTTIVQKIITDDILENWENLDIIDDSIPGISLKKAYQTILKGKKGEPVIIAFLDQPIDIDHEMLKNHIWTNEDEISNNGIDDDNNGYKDDIHGWDFLGNSQGIDNKYTHFDFTRFVKAYQDLFEDKDLKTIYLDDSLRFVDYTLAKRKLKNRIESIPKDIEYANNVYKWKNEAKQVILKYIKPSNLTNFTVKELDSVKILFPQDSLLQIKVKILSGFIKKGFTKEYIESLKNKAEKSISHQLNIEYNERSFLGDDPENLNNIEYGIAKVNNNLEVYSHGTRISGVIVKNTSKVKIMPLSILGHGSSHDKDIALAVRYAVNNGAKVINMSFSKTFSLHKDWVDSAIRYAEKNNVVVVTSAGNGYDNVDANNKLRYPNDINSRGKEFVDNFITVGSSSYHINTRKNYIHSNFGKNNVDIFAPGEKIYTTKPNNQYYFDFGTSLSAALTSKVAALIFSYYPDLTASQVKHIIMDSGVKYTFPVSTPTKEDENKMTPFDELSKSGKIVNAYNALIMADSISKVNMRK